ncbi:trypsin-like peptidase domain-containing protein [Stieleria sp. ICT_E10.1]|uniref:S1C family serine protease n=1 Tax=Stieleria sedimenti TaxID=2976331 RepID=UPI0021801C3D|nr:trypsin-like peptidase domain-containing protein [Stieleria sedimenti]MCS7467597.1 trypsin-like peptidase domain-containing protein [Stieleria sedimenti]
MQSEDAIDLRRQLRLTWLLLTLVTVVFVWPTVRVWLGIGMAASGIPRVITPRGDLAAFEQSTVELFRTVSPSVVYLTTRSRVASPFSRRAIEVDAGSGSGFMWDEFGHIVTNFHVLQDASSAKVVLWDQSSYEAILVGGSADHDLAVLKINAPAAKLRPVAIGTSEDLLVGQAVFAIGNPFGLNQTLTTGVVSAKSRSIDSPTGRSIEEVIQIDAAINPGNSGGPLLDSAGRLIGVNTAIYSPSGTSAGVGFSIPVDTVNRVVPQIIANGRYEPPQLGIRVHRELSEVVTTRLGVEGVLILHIVPGGPADRAGLRETVIGQSSLVRPGDIIQKIGDATVGDMNDMLEALEHHRVGETVTVQFLREGQTETVDVVLQ